MFFFYFFLFVFFDVLTFFHFVCRVSFTLSPLSFFLCVHQDASQNQRLLEQQLEALKADAKLGIIDEDFMDVRAVETVLFAAEAAKSCSAARLAAGDDPHGCSAAVDFSTMKIEAVRRELQMQRRRLVIQTSRSKKQKKQYNAHMSECKNDLLGYIKRTANATSDQPDVVMFDNIINSDESFINILSSSSGISSKRSPASMLSHSVVSPQRRKLKLQLFTTNSGRGKGTRMQAQSFEETKASSGGETVLNSVSQLRPTYYVRKRKELGLDDTGRKGKLPPRRSVLKMTPALSALLNSSRLPRTSKDGKYFSKKTSEQKDSARDARARAKDSPMVLAAASAAEMAAEKNKAKHTTSERQHEKKNDTAVRLLKEKLQEQTEAAEERRRNNKERREAEKKASPMRLPLPLPLPSPLPSPSPPSLSPSLSPSSPLSSLPPSLSPLPPSLSPLSQLPIAPPAPPPGIPPATSTPDGAVQNEKRKEGKRTSASTSPLSSLPTAHPTDGTGISVDAIHAMLSTRDKRAASSTAVRTASTRSPEVPRPQFHYRSVKHRRKSDGLFAFTPSLDVTPAEERNMTHKKLNSIEKTTKARILNTIADAIHQRRSLFGTTISSVRRAFAAFDRSGDGLISSDEFRSGARRLDLGLSEIQMRACFDVLSGGNGLHAGINYNDFTNALQHRRDSLVN